MTIYSSIVLKVHFTLKKHRHLKQYTYDIVQGLRDSKVSNCSVWLTCHFARHELTASQTDILSDHNRSLAVDLRNNRHYKVLIWLLLSNVLTCELKPISKLRFKAVLEAMNLNTMLLQCFVITEADETLTLS